MLPLALTVAIVVFLVNFLTKPFMGLVSAFLTKSDFVNRGFLFLSPEQFIKYGSQLLILVGIFFLTVAIGMFARWFFVKSLIGLSDKILHKIPIVNKVYKTTQEIIKTLFSSDKNSFRQVVMAPYPHENAYVMGLVARESPKVCEDAAGSEMLSVLIPTTPNPTTGFLLMYKKQDLIFLDLRPEDAIKYIVSCGVITPENPLPLEKK